ncbi:amidase domain-containing protein [Pseudobacillus sp. 179-B 2D1 NHS]|uniref:amidase domain-containing protein n=1 Tax=Pseudobacillus sp. 179-B 2D1 NHS TaxID=3374292 RepID=UPI003879B7E9
MKKVFTKPLLVVPSTLLVIDLLFVITIPFIWLKINVSDFYTFWSKTQPTKASKNKQDLINYTEPDDVIQFKKDQATRYSHTMFVYSKGDGTLYLSGHTDNYLTPIILKR